MASLETSTLEAKIDIIEQQQHFYEVFGHESSILYDCYTSKESLAQKIDLILPQKNEIERNELITTIWNQNVYNGGNCLLMSPIYITLDLDNHIQCVYKLQSKSFQVQPVFRVQKCTPKLPVEGGDGDNCCAVFIDEFGHVYMNWNTFRTHNVYADGLVVAPMNGIYNASPENKVKLEFFQRKAGITSSPDRKSIRNAVDIAKFVGGRIAGPIGAGIAGLTVSGIQGISNLFDGKKKTSKYTHPKVRSSWINLAAEAGATQPLAKADDNSADTTNIIPSTDVPFNALGLHSAGCLEDIYLMISRMYKSENLSTMEICHLSTQLYLLTHSVKNQRATEEILSLSQARELIYLKKILRDSQKMAINGLVHETTAIQGLDSQKIGQITVRSLKNQIDPQPNLMKMKGEEHEGIEKGNLKQETIKRKYLEMFESRIASVGSHDDEKIEMAMGYAVESVISKFQALNIVYMKEDLRETVKDILLSVPLGESHIFFNIVTKFTTKNAEQIQSRLGRFIPIDIFMTDIYNLLIKLSISRGQELEQYLLHYNESGFEDIEKQICQFYDNQIVAGDSNKCSHCAGFYYN